MAPWIPALMARRFKVRTRINAIEGYGEIGPACPVRACGSAGLANYQRGLFICPFLDTFSTLSLDLSFKLLPLLRFFRVKN